MTHKTKQAALKAARAEMGDEAIEGVDFNLKATGTGWEHQPIPPANDATAAAQADRLAPPAKAKGPTKRGLGGKPKETRDQKRLRLIAEADARNAAKASGVDDFQPAPGKLNKALSRPVATKAPRKPAKAATPKPSAPEGQSKTDMLVGMLSTAGGATSKEMEAKTGWKPHSVRGLLGTLRKRGVTVVSKKLKGEPTIYRISKAKPQSAPVEESIGDVV